MLNLSPESTHRLLSALPFEDRRNISQRGGSPVLIARFHFGHRRPFSSQLTFDLMEKTAHCVPSAHPHCFLGDRTTLCPAKNSKFQAVAKVAL